MAGAANGFFYSLIGGGDRLSNVEPAGAGNGRISDGFNKNWNLGGGLAPNRTALPSNTGAWPNPLRFALAGPNTIPPGGSFEATLRYQAGATASGTVDLTVLLDPDSNPYNGNEIAVEQRTLGRSGTDAVLLHDLTTFVNGAAVAPGSYAVCARLHDGGRTRYLYAGRQLIVTPAPQAPAIDAASLARENGVVRFDVYAAPGQVVTVEATTDFLTWTSLQTHVLTSGLWEFVDANAGQFERRFYRAVPAPQNRE